MSMIFGKNWKRKDAVLAKSLIIILSSVAGFRSLPFSQQDDGHALLIFFFFNDTATTEIYTLSLHDALPISSTASCSMRVPVPVPPYSVAKGDRKSTRLNSSHVEISYAVFCLKKKKKTP